MPPASRRIGQPVDLIPSAKPAMMFVAAPVWDAAATDRAGFFDSAVKYSVMNPMAIPIARPMTMEAKSSTQASGQRVRMTGMETKTITTPAPRVPMFRAACGLPPSFVLTTNVPAIEQMIPTPAITKGRMT